MADRPIADRIEINEPLCVACECDLLAEEADLGFCAPCRKAIEAERENGPACPYCRVAPCADPDGCRREASREDAAERARDGEGS